MRAGAFTLLFKDSEYRKGILYMDREYAVYAAEAAKDIIAIDSPTGYTAEAAKYTVEIFRKLGFETHLTEKGGVIVDFGGEDENDALMLQAHIDTLGAMVCEVKGNGRLRVTPLGGLPVQACETENVRVRTRDGKVYEGTILLNNPSLHVNLSYRSAERNWDAVQVVLDEDINSGEQARELGIENGDIVCLEPRTRITEKGYIKSRFLDDKLSVGILVGFGKYLKDNSITPKRKVYAHITVYEEVGHGGSGSVIPGTTEAISIDMGCVGDGLRCNERMVSICAKDAATPYSYEVVGKLIDAAKRTGADYAVDVYPGYSSDVDTTLKAGYDIRHGLVGPGVYASHGYERSHIDGVWNTLKVICGYIGIL